MHTTFKKSANTYWCPVNMRPTSFESLFPLSKMSTSKAILFLMHSKSKKYPNALPLTVQHACHQLD